MKKQLPKVMISSQHAEPGSGLIDSRPNAGEPCAPTPTRVDPQNETITKIDSDFSAPAEVTQSWSRSALRRKCAERIVKRHVAMAGFGGIIPMPIVNIAGITAIILRMLKMLARLYGVPFERARARPLVISLLGGALPTGLGVATSSTLIYLLPGSNLVGMAVSSISAVACTRGIGYTFIEHFEKGGTLSEYQQAPSAAQAAPLDS